MDDDDDDAGSSKSLFERLPRDVMLYVLRMLRARDLCALARTSRTLRRAADSDEAWYALRRRECMEDIFMGALRSGKEIYRWYTQARRPIAPDPGYDGVRAVHRRTGRRERGTDNAYTGEWANNDIDGFGVVYAGSKTTSIFSGRFEDDEPDWPMTTRIYNGPGASLGLRDTVVCGADPFFCVHEVLCFLFGRERYVAVGQSLPNDVDRGREIWSTSEERVVIGAAIRRSGTADGPGAIFYLDDGCMYAGAIDTCTPHSKGTLHWADGSFFHGIFERGARVRGIYWCARSGALETQFWRERDGSVRERRGREVRRPPRPPDGGGGGGGALLLLPATPRVDMQAAVARFMDRHRRPLAALARFTRECHFLDKRRFPAPESE